MKWATRMAILACREISQPADRSDTIGFQYAGQAVRAILRKTDTPACTRGPRTPSDDHARAGEDREPHPTLEDGDRRPAVGDAGRRRQGPPAEGGRRARLRLQPRRAGLP